MSVAVVKTATVNAKCPPRLSFSVVVACAVRFDVMDNLEKFLVLG